MRKAILTFQIERPSNHIEISPDGAFISVGSSYGEIYFFNTSDLEAVKPVKQGEDPEDPDIIHTID